jgi:hypothetical protein
LKQKKLRDIKHAQKGRFVPFGEMKACAEVVTWLHPFLTSELDGMSGQLHVPAALPQRMPPPDLYPLNRVATASLDAFERRKISCPFEKELPLPWLLFSCEYI